MPKPPSGKTYEKRYTEKDLSAAVTAIKDGMPKREAARKFRIPRATLQFRLSSDLIKTRPGPSTILTETEEKKLADWIITSSKKGFPKRKEDVLHSVEQFMIKTPRVSKFKDNKPGEGWYKLFLKRHPDIAKRTAEAVTSASANVSEENVKNWFKQIENTLTNEERKILDDPSRIFNGDETGFQLCPKQGTVLAEKGSKDVYEIDMAAAKSSITVMFTFSASGKVTPPLIIYPLKRMREDIRRSVPSHWGISLSDNGWMTKEIFFQYVTNILYPHLVSEDVTFPVILFVDGHKSHINYELSEKCKELGIVLVALYPNATRILQPADVAAFKPIKNDWKKALLEWRRNNFSKQLTKVDFGRVLTTVVANIKQEVIINGFRACGLYPWNPNAINYAKCLGKQKEANPAPCPDKKLTMTDFQSLVGSDVFSELQNEALIQDDNFYKALKNVYKFLKDETVSVNIPDDDQRRILIDDEWLPIDDLPFFVVPGAGEGVEECITVTSDKNSKSLANHDIVMKVTETDQNEKCGQNISMERKNVIETTNMEMETNQKDHKVSADNPKDIGKNENVTNMKKVMIDDSENRHVETLETEIVIENNTHTENRDINGYDLDKICIEAIETENNEQIQVNLKQLEQIFGELDSTDSLYKTTSPAKIDDFLYKAPTPKRKGKILSKHSSIYVMTSDKWLESEKNKQDEKEKAIAVKLERKRNRELVKEAKLLKRVETQNKKLSKRKCTAEKENKINIDAPKDNKRQNRLKSDETQRKLEDETDTTLTKETEITKINVIEEKDIIKEKTETLIKTKIQAEVSKTQKTDVNKNKEKKNGTEKHSTKKAKIIATDKINVNENKINTVVPKNNKRQNRLKSDETQSKLEDETDTTLTKETEITKMNVIEEKDIIKEKTETLIKTKIQAEVSKNQKTDVNKNKEKKNGTEKHSTKKAKIIATDKINVNENKINIDAPKNNKRQNRLKSDETQSKLEDETDTTLTKETEITKMNVIEEKDIIKEKTETLKPANKNSRVNVTSVVPISVNPAKNVKRRLFDDSCYVKPSEYVLKPPKILKRRSTFRNEEELQEYLNNEYGQ